MWRDLVLRQISWVLSMVPLYSRSFSTHHQIVLTSWALWAQVRILFSSRRRLKIISANWVEPVGRACSRKRGRIDRTQLPSINYHLRPSTLVASVFSPSSGSQALPRFTTGSPNPSLFLIGSSRLCPSLFQGSPKSRLCPFPPRSSPVPLTLQVLLKSIDKSRHSCLISDFRRKAYFHHELQSYVLYQIEKFPFCY